MRRTELLLPAGSPEGLKTALRYGADAVYLGGEAYGLRAKARNFSMDEILSGVRYAHDRGARVYVTANILARNGDLSGVREYFRELRGSGVDAVLIADPGIFLLAREEMPEMELHISTQANCTNYESFLFWHRLGAKRVVAARELSLSELSEIRRRIPASLEIEAFVHGAMCMSYSGRCFLSDFMTGRDANHGECTHPCRWNYRLVEEKRPGEYFPVYENERGTYILSSQDLSMIGHIPELLSAGIDSLKVEGRMKTELYTATVGRAYRRAIDDFYEDPEKYRRKLPGYRDELERCTHREYSTGFYFGPPKPGAKGQRESYERPSVYLGRAREPGTGGFFTLRQKNKFSVGEEIRIMKPDGRDIPAVVLEIRDKESGIAQDSCPHAGQELMLRLTACPEEGDILRRDG